MCLFTDIARTLNALRRLILRRFLSSHRVGDVMDFVRAFDLSPKGPFLLRTNLPIVRFSDPTKTLAEVNFAKRMNLFVEKSS